MPNRLIGVYPEAVTRGVLGLADDAPLDNYALRLYENGTSTLATLVNEDGESIAQPLFTNSAGLLEVHPYVDAGTLFRVEWRDPDGAVLDGFPKDDVPAIGADLNSAAGMPFTPTDDIPETTVQAAIEAVGELALAQDALVARSLTPWTTAGSGDAYTITPTPAITAYAAGTAFLVRANRANTAAATLNVSGLGARDWRKLNTSGAAVAVEAGDVLAWQNYLVVDDGTRFVTVLGQQPRTVTNANGTAVFHPDGRLEMSRVEAVNLTSAGYVTYSFPATPTAIPGSGGWIVSRSAGTVPGGDIGVLTGGLIPMLTSTSWVLYCDGSGASASFSSLRFSAFGRWY